MTFSEWWDTYKLPPWTYEEYLCAQSAWEAALSEAVKACRKNPCQYCLGSCTDCHDTDIQSIRALKGKP